jgi:hypothetical protein
MYANVSAYDTCPTETHPRTLSSALIAPTLVFQDNQIISKIYCILGQPELAM